MVLPFLGDMGMGQFLLQMVLLLAFFMLFPRLMIFQMMYKIKKSMGNLEETAKETEDTFIQAVNPGSKEETREKLEPMKNMVVSGPTDLDPAGLVDKLEHLLDVSDDRMERYVEELSDGEMDEEEKANLSMGFKGVYGSNQIFVLVRHFKELIQDTKSYQLAGMLQMMLPLYEELAESQKEATEAFANEVPIGDSVGPLVAAKFMDNEPEEVAEDVVVSHEEQGEKDVHVLKSKGPGSRLGKYGDAIEQVVEEEDIGKMIFVDAGMRFEGEDTGKVVDGVGVLMGGPGVEKFKIEEIAEEHDVPLEGFIVKQSGPQASKPMHSDIYRAVPDVVQKVEDEIMDTEDGGVLLVGVGNTVGVGNSRGSTSGIPNKLKPYWEEEEEETTSYFGLMKAFPMGGGGDFYEAENTFELFRGLVR
ncbi:MAG: DUF1512 family protein [Candidatus Nanohaloarchaea archaeon]